MTVAPPPFDEAARIQALRRLEVLDTGPDLVLDGLARCAAHVSGCPVSLVSLVDEARQWFKAKVGVNLAETPRDLAFCSHAILGDTLMEVRDTASDPRFADNPLVSGPLPVRFYAGVPIGDQGHNLGTLCVIDHQPRTLSEVQKTLLVDLARMVSVWFVARREHLELEAQRRQAWERIDRLEGVAMQVPGMLFEFHEPAQGPGGFRYVSQRARDIFELEPTEIEHDLGALVRLVHPQERVTLTESLARAAVRLRPWAHEFRVVLPKAGVRWRLAQATPSRHRDGSVHWYGIVTDVTARRARHAVAAELHQRWQLAVTAAQLGLVSIDLERQSVLLDALACAQHGLQAQSSELALDNWLGLFDLDAVARAVLRTQICSITPGETLSLACDLPLPGPQAVRRLELIAQATAPYPVTRAGPPTATPTAHTPATPRIIGTCRDVTAQYQGEQLRRQALAAEQSSREKSLFLSRLSHELRTPLNAILGFAQLMQEDTQERLGPRHRAQVAHVHEAGRLLLGLVDKVLDLGAGPDARRMDLGPVDSKQIVLECKPLLTPMARKAGVSVRIGVARDLPLVRADALALKQVLLNLMSNGIKYNRPGGRLAVTLEPAPDAVRITVRDQGQGLTPEQRNRLFQPFDRLGAEHSATEGSGLGLLIARELVEAMGGRIEVKSQPGSGSAFAVLLPQHQGADTAAERPAAAAQVPDPPASDGPLRDVTLLYIEDEPVNAILVQEALRQRPHWKLTLASDGSTGLALARALRPAIVLSDINLPGLSGLEVVRELRTDPLGSGLVCIALSADAMPHQIEKAMDAGFDDYWVKPLDLASIPARIERWLQATSARRGRESDS